MIIDELFGHREESTDAFAQAFRDSSMSDAVQLSGAGIRTCSKRLLGWILYTAAWLVRPSSCTPAIIRQRQEPGSRDMLHVLRMIRAPATLIIAGGDIYGAPRGMRAPAYPAPNVLWRWQLTSLSRKFPRIFSKLNSWLAVVIMTKSVPPRIFFHYYRARVRKFVASLRSARPGICSREEFLAAIF